MGYKGNEAAAYWERVTLIYLFSAFNLWRMKKYKPEITVKINIEGRLEDVLADVSRFRPLKADSLVTISLEVKSAGGNWTEPYSLPVLNSPNTIPAKTVLEGLYKQGRIGKEQYDEVNAAIDKLGNCANERSYRDRYAKSGMAD